MMTSSFADAIATKVLSTFNCCPGNGKPKHDSNLLAEFTVLAAIVVIKKCSPQNHNDVAPDITVISMGTGTKCAGKSREDVNGFIMSDSHAEILARRGFVRWLSKCTGAMQICPLLHLDDNFPLREVSLDDIAQCTTHSTARAPYAVKNDWSFYLYISDSPCGDATIYPRTVNDTETSGFTGAKVVRSTTTLHSNAPSGINMGAEGNISSSTFDSRDQGCCQWEREGVQDFGVMRTKSGRSDILVQNRTTSMSCSDKICR
jgi:tRNA-specific adenosine deaminase 1